jgi:hypothetical protein
MDSFFATSDKKGGFRPDIVPHADNPSYSGGRD